jgi:molybdate transport system substrate-binding protein
LKLGFWRFIFAGLIFCLATSVSAQTPVVAVAANMKGAFEEILQAFQKQHPQEIKVVYGGSGNFYRQLIQGAPFGLFISADEEYPRALFKAGLTQVEPRVYATGEIVLLAKKSRQINWDGNPESVRKILLGVKKIALAKPDIAPYGRAAVEYLKAVDAWDEVKTKIVYADNISAATVFVTTGAVDLGFSAISFAKSPELVKDYDVWPLSNRLYQPIRQSMVLMNQAPALLAQLYQFMQEPQAVLILQKYGYGSVK